MEYKVGKVLGRSGVIPIYGPMQTFKEYNEAKAEYDRLKSLDRKGVYDLVTFRYDILEAYIGQVKTSTLSAYSTLFRYSDQSIGEFGELVSSCSNSSDLYFRSAILALKHIKKGRELGEIRPTFKVRIHTNGRILHSAFTRHGLDMWNPEVRNFGAIRELINLRNSAGLFNFKFLVKPSPRVNLAIDYCIKLINSANERTNESGYLSSHV